MAKKIIDTNEKIKDTNRHENAVVWNFIIKISGYISMGAAIFSGGYFTGQYISDLKSTENNIKTLSEFQKEREQMKEERDKLKNELNLYKFSNPNYATKEELEELKTNLNKFTKRHIK